MKSVLITFDQAYYERIMALLDRLGCRGFTYLEKVHCLLYTSNFPLEKALERKGGRLMKKRCILWLLMSVIGLPLIAQNIIYSNLKEMCIRDRTYMNGFCGDSAYTFCVGEVDEEIRNLLKVTKEALYIGIPVSYTHLDVYKRQVHY